MKMNLCSVKQSDFFQQMEFHKETKVNLINLSKINKGFFSAVDTYYLEMTKCLLNFVHIKKQLSGLVKQDNFWIYICGVTFKTNMIHSIHSIILISPIDLPILKQTKCTLHLRYLI